MSVLAVIPARGGSVGLPGKNLKPLGGLPLIVHSILLAGLCPEIDRTIVSTDSEEIASVAREHGADVPFLRPASLAADDTPMWPVLQHALAQAEDGEARYDTLLLLDPTSPARLPGDVAGALARLGADPEADGIVGVSEPSFNPIWHAVVERDGYLEPLVAEASAYGRRQDVPRVLRINASLYAWRTAFVREPRATWVGAGRYLVYEIPEERAVHIDEPRDLELLELLLREHMISLPWLEAED